MGLLTPETMLEGILVLYQEVYQLKRDPGGVQCSTGAAEEAHAETLEVLKACLWHRQGSFHPEEPTDRPPAHGQRLSTMIEPGSSSPGKRP